MAARLSRFYNIAPRDVLCMSGQLRHAMIRMMPRIQAEETAMLVNAIAAGTATMDKKDRAKYTRRLNRQMQPAKRRRGQAVAPKSARDFAEAVAAKTGLPMIVQHRNAAGELVEREL